jgi:hypothetical protein
VDEVWAAVLGGVIALMGAYVGARWQAHFAAVHRRSARMHESLVTLYSDILTEVHLSREWLDSMVYPGVEVVGTWPNRAAISGRVRLLASQQVQEAWSAYVRAVDSLSLYIHKSGGLAGGNLLDKNNEFIIKCRTALPRLQTALHAHLKEEGPELARGSRFWQRAHALFRRRTGNPSQQRHTVR